MALNITSIFSGTGPALTELMLADKKLSKAERALREESYRSEDNALLADSNESKARALLELSKLIAEQRDEYKALLEAQTQQIYNLKRLIHGEAATVQALAEALHCLQPGHPLLHYTEDGEQMRISDELYYESMRIADSALPLDAPNRPSYWSQVPRKQT